MSNGLLSGRPMVTYQTEEKSSQQESKTLVLTQRRWAVFGECAFCRMIARLEQDKDDKARGMNARHFTGGNRPKSFMFCCWMKTAKRTD